MAIAGGRKVSSCVGVPIKTVCDLRSSRHFSRLVSLPRKGAYAPYLRVLDPTVTRVIGCILLWFLEPESSHMEYVASLIGFCKLSSSPLSKATCSIIGLLLALALP